MHYEGQQSSEIYAFESKCSVSNSKRLAVSAEYVRSDILLFIRVVGRCSQVSLTFSLFSSTSFLGLKPRASSLSAANTRNCLFMLHLGSRVTASESEWEREGARQMFLSEIIDTMAHGKTKACRTQHICTASAHVEADADMFLIPIVNFFLLAFLTSPDDSLSLPTQHPLTAPRIDRHATAFVAQSKLTPGKMSNGGAVILRLSIASQKRQ